MVQYSTAVLPGLRIGHTDTDIQRHRQTNTDTDRQTDIDTDTDRQRHDDN